MQGIKLIVGIGNWYFGQLMACSSLKPFQDPPRHSELWALTEYKSLAVDVFLFIAFISEL